MDKEDVITKVIDCAYSVHKALMPGYLEAIYKNALIIELQIAGFDVEWEKHLNVFYRDVCVGDYIADIMVNGSIILEIKAARALDSAHEAQLVNYMTTTGIEHGLLINFGSPRIEIKRKDLNYIKKKNSGELSTRV